MGTRELIEFICDNCGETTHRSTGLTFPPRGWAKWIDGGSSQGSESLLCSGCVEVVRAAFEAERVKRQQEKTDQTSDKGEGTHTCHDHDLSFESFSDLMAHLESDHPDLFAPEQQSVIPSGPGWKGTDKQCPYTEENFECTSMRGHTSCHTDLTRNETRFEKGKVIACEAEGEGPWGEAVFCTFPTGHGGDHSWWDIRTSDKIVNRVKTSDEYVAIPGEDQLGIEQALVEQNIYPYPCGVLNCDGNLISNYRYGWCVHRTEKDRTVESPQIDSEHEIAQGYTDVPLGPESGSGSISAPSRPLVDIWHCTACTKSFPTFEDRAQHIYWDHQDEDPWKRPTRTESGKIIPGVTRCAHQTQDRGCDKLAGHAGAHYDPDAKIDWTGGQIYV